MGAWPRAYGLQGLGNVQRTKLPHFPLLPFCGLQLAGGRAGTWTSLALRQPQGWDLLGTWLVWGEHKASWDVRGQKSNLNQ